VLPDYSETAWIPLELRTSERAGKVEVVFMMNMSREGGARCLEYARGLSVAALQAGPMGRLILNFN